MVKRKAKKRKLDKNHLNIKAFFRRLTKLKKEKPELFNELMNTEEPSMLLTNWEYTPKCVEIPIDLSRYIKK